MGRHFNWQPSEIDDMDAAELALHFDAAIELLRAEKEAEQ